VGVKQRGVIKKLKIDMTTRKTTEKSRGDVNCAQRGDRGSCPRDMRIDGAQDFKWSKRVKHGGTAML
jgi:hypothetical protein